MSREKTYIDEMSCKMIDEMSDSMVDDMKDSRRREFYDIGLSGRPKVADSSKHTGGSHLCEDGDAHEAIERRRSVDYRTVNSESRRQSSGADNVFTYQGSAQQKNTGSSKSSNKSLLSIILLILFIIGGVSGSIVLIILSIVGFIFLASNKNNGNKRR